MRTYLQFQIKQIIINYFNRKHLKQTKNWILNSIENSSIDSNFENSSIDSNLLIQWIGIRNRDLIVCSKKQRINFCVEVWGDGSEDSFLGREWKATVCNELVTNNELPYFCKSLLNFVTPHFGWLANQTPHFETWQFVTLSFI